MTPETKIKMSLMGDKGGNYAPFILSLVDR